MHTETKASGFSYNFFAFKLLSDVFWDVGVFVLGFTFFGAVLFGAVFVLDFDFDAALIPFELDVFGFDARELLDFLPPAPLKSVLKIPFFRFPIFVKELAEIVILKFQQVLYLLYLRNYCASIIERFSRLKAFCKQEHRITVVED